MRQALVLPPVGRYSRKPIFTDALEAQIIAGHWSAPHAGDKVALPDGTSRSWSTAEADKDGTISNDALRGGYAYWGVEVAGSGVYLLDAAAHSMVYVNGEPRAGDPYGYGTMHLPMLLHAGRNDLLFACGQGHVRAKLTAPKAEAELDVSDTTLPDLIAGERIRTQGALVVINATSAPQDGLVLSAAPGNARPILTDVPSLLPLSARKVAFRLQGGPPGSGDTVPIQLHLLKREHGRLRSLDTAEIKLRVRHAGQTYKRTFISDIDGSVQYYAVNPATADPRTEPPPALALTLHGAGVEAIGQVDAYESKSWINYVAPTNRRPYGFDWEDWGRLDALEVLDLAQRDLHVDPYRTYLAGHSMGGHGTWQIGALFPDHFAAIGPSAGWISFTSYAGVKAEANPSPIESLLERAALPSDTLAMGHNYAQEGVYILHGSTDDNVPVDEARTMAKYLSGFHHDYCFHEQPGAGHWWDISPEPGADCVDWAPMYDFFAHHTLPVEASVRQIDFATPDPGISARCHWLQIEAQIHCRQISSVSIRYDPGLRMFSGTTQNVGRLQFDLRSLRNRVFRSSGVQVFRKMPTDELLTIELDGQNLENVAVPSDQRLWLTRTGGVWAVTSAPSPNLKSPERSGPFKAAFRNRMLFVYGTRGTPEENAWAFAKARYDAETFWYRGNGSIDVVADTAFDPNRDHDRNVILYGNADTNGDWQALLADSPVQVNHKGVRIGARQEQGGDLACLFVRPRPGSDKALVGVVAGSGPIGMRLTDRLPYFVSGISYPDVVVLVAGASYPDVTLIGSRAPADGAKRIIAAGFFGPDWSVESGDFAWR